MLHNTGAVAAVGVVVMGHDVVELLPGEACDVGDATRAEGWNARL